jgi:hypothetical protein
MPDTTNRSDKDCLFCGLNEICSGRGVPCQVALNRHLITGQQRLAVGSIRTEFSFEAEKVGEAPEVAAIYPPVKGDSIRAIV